MQPKKRISQRKNDTACAVPDLAAAATRLQDAKAERLLLKGLLSEATELVPHLITMGFDKGDFYYDLHQKCYDAAMWLYHGSTTGPLYAAVFGECLSRRDWFGNFDAPLPLAFWLVDVFAEPTPEAWDDGGKVVSELSIGEVNWALNAHTALAAAARVQHLATRRYAVHVASELLRDAINPTDGAEGTERRAGEWEA